MKPQTTSLFEQEMRDQVAAARAAVTEAEQRGEPLLLQAAQSHCDALVDLARRNGIVVDPAEQPAGAAAATLGEEPLTAPTS